MHSYTQVYMQIPINERVSPFFFFKSRAPSTLSTHRRQSLSAVWCVSFFPPPPDKRTVCCLQPRAVGLCLRHEITCLQRLLFSVRSSSPGRALPKWLRTDSARVLMRRFNFSTHFVQGCQSLRRQGTGRRPWGASGAWGGQKFGDRRPCFLNTC